MKRDADLVNELSITLGNQHCGDFLEIAGVLSSWMFLTGKKFGQFKYREFGLSAVGLLA
jgi:hypothetical protein